MKPFDNAQGIARLTLAFILIVAAAASCARKIETPPAKEFQFGARRVQLVVPEGWEALDHGSLKRFRKGEFQIVLTYLGNRMMRPFANTDQLIDWALEELGHNQRREVKSRREVTIDGRKALDIETWQRLDHTNPQRFLFVIDDNDLLALYTEGMAFQDTLAAFDAIRDSLHFVSARP